MPDTDFSPHGGFKTLWVSPEYGKAVATIAGETQEYLSFIPYCFPRYIADSLLRMRGQFGPIFQELYSKIAPAVCS